MIKDATDVPGGADGLFLKLADGSEMRLGIMKYSDEFDTPYPLFESGTFLQREINQTDEIIGELSGVTYRTTANSEVKINSTMNIISESDGTLKIKIVNAGLSLTQVASKFDGYSLIKTWVQSSGVNASALSRMIEWADDVTGEGAIFLQKLEDDFVRLNGLASLSEFKAGLNRPSFFDGWVSLSKRAEIRLDPKTLEAMERLMNNAINNAFVKSNQTIFDKLFESLAGAAKCRSCPSNPTFFDPKVGYIEDVIDDLADAINKYSSDPSFKFMDFLNDIKRTNKTVKGGAYSLKLLKNNFDELCEDGKYIFEGFEGTPYQGVMIEDPLTNHLVDLRFKSVDGGSFKLVEVKNWSGVFPVNKNQLQAYFMSGNNFKYRFNGNGTQMKSEFQKIFVDNADEWFGPIQHGGFDQSILLKYFGTNNLNVFKSRIANLDDTIYSFIK